jgi:hypothetical protein
MPDLVIRKEDGWIEISDLLPELSQEALRELWGYVGKGDVDEAEAVLDMEAGSDLEDLIGTAKITAIRMITVPDDVLGERLRAWIRT